MFTKNHIILFAIGISIFSCANKGQGPMGGKKDETPPRVLKEVPLNGSLNFTKKSIHIQFDENIALEKLSDNVVISPPQQKQPVINAFGKNLYVDFNDTLQANTTYSIDFGNAIVDLNEKNPLKNFVFAFATGNEIDTLRISGNVLKASDLNTMSGITVGIYQYADNDSDFVQKPFLRIGKTDAEGHFSIKNMKAGNYKIYALGDVSRDYYFQTGEGLALYDSLIAPQALAAVFNDTIWKDSLTIDTVLLRNGTRFVPDDLVLQYFKENKPRQYFIKNERKTPQSFTLFFNAPADSLPTITPLNFNWDNNYIVQKNATLDTLTYWLTDSTVWQQDTLKMQVDYLKSDSLFQLVPQTDSISSIFRHPRTNKKPTSKTVKMLDIKTNVQSVFDVYRAVVLQFEEPVQSTDLQGIKLKEKIDTVFKDLSYTWAAMDSTKMKFSLSYQWEPEKSYQLLVDSASFSSIYGIVNNKYKADFKIRSLEEYSSVRVVISPFDARVVLQLLDTKDAPISSKPAQEDGVLFEYLKPTDYYIRMFIDENGNGKWDTGSLDAHRQPEQVYYYNKKLTLMANWEFEEKWEQWSSVPLMKQKPQELRKDGNEKK